MESNPTIEKPVGYGSTEGRILEYFRKRADAGLAPPTLREISKHCGWVSSGAARYHVNRMVKKGLLAHEPGRARAAHLAETVSFKVPFVLEHGSSRVRPMNIDIPKALLTSAEQPFVVQAQHSNPSCGIKESDLLVLRDDRRPVQGDLVAVLDDGEVRVAKQRRTSGARKAKVLGVVTGLMRRYAQEDDD